MKALLLRIGIDKGTDGTLGPIFEDGTFEFVPISERDAESQEERTYGNTIGRSGKPLATYLPPRLRHKTMHFDPEFDTYTYGDPTAKRKYLLNLEKGDLLVFYAGLAPYQNIVYQEALYIIGFFTVQKVIDFNILSVKEIRTCRQLYGNNAHMKRSYSTENLVVVTGDRKRSRLLSRAMPISQKKPTKNGRLYDAVSAEMEALLGISGFIYRSIPPRVIKRKCYLDNLKRILG